MKDRLTLAMIVKNEEHNLAQCLKSVRDHVGPVVVVDTGSTDGTKAVAAQFGARVVRHDPETNPESFFRDDEETCRTFGAPGPYSGEIMLGDFGAARRAAFAEATTDYILWLDADDVLERSERLLPIVADMASRNLDMGFLAYDYARDAEGRTYYRQWRERIIRRGCANWVNPVHEVLLPTRAITSARYDEGPNVAHHRKADRPGPAHRNYKILLRQIHQDKQAGREVDPRTLFYLGQESRWVEPERSVKFYEEYLQKSGWGEERAAAHVALGQMREFGQLPGTPEDNYAIANREYATAAAEMPDNPDGLFGLARIAYLRKRYHDCVGFTERGFKIGNTESMLGANPMDRVYRPHVYYNHALGLVGRIDEAIASCRAGLTVCPDDPGVPGGAPGMLKHNLSVWEAAKADAQPPAAPKPVLELSKDEDVEAPPEANIPADAMVIWAMQLWKQVAHVERDAIKSRELLRALPAVVQRDPVWAKLKASTVRRFPPEWIPRPEADATEPTATSSKKRVVIYTGGCFEAWNPDSPREVGIGGSETACIEMAKHLAALGCKVDVYNEYKASHQGNMWDGVTYHHHSEFKGADCDVFISSRAPWAIDNFGPVKAGVKLLWVHDIHCGANDPHMQRWLLKFDRILCLSEWHKGFFRSVYPTVDPARVVVTRNGIDPGRFATPVPKTNSMVFSSSPNRGLDWLLPNFQMVRQRVPDAELHIYYGFDCWEAIARANDNQAELQEIARYKEAIRAAVAQGGVHYHGRRPQPEVAEAYLRAKVWPYLTGFTETSCITAMEAQAAGAVPVCSSLAALGETVKHGSLFDNNDLQTPQRWFDEVIHMLTDEPYRAFVAEAGRKYALENLSWKSLAADWLKMFDHVAKEQKSNPLPAYMEVA